MHEKRRKIWIDRFQTLLFWRIALYFVVYQALVWSLVYVERRFLVALETILGPDGILVCFGFMTLIVVCTGLLFIYDAIKLAHRIVGPIYRFRKTIRAITAGEELELTNLRKGDFLVEMRDELNEMLKALEQRGAVVLKTPAAKQDQNPPLAA